MNTATPENNQSFKMVFNREQQPSPVLTVSKQQHACLKELTAVFFQSTKLLLTWKLAMKLLGPSICNICN